MINLQAFVRVGLIAALVAGGEVMGESMRVRRSAPAIEVSQSTDKISIRTDALEAVVRKQGYVSGIAAGSLMDRKSGFRDAGFGLDIVDWLMEPGSDETSRDRLPGDLKYEFNNLFHGKRPKRSIEGPQICTQAKTLAPEVVAGRGFAAVKMTYQYKDAAPGKKVGSVWDQTLLFLPGKRYFLSCDRITLANGGRDLFLRLDMPGHIRHSRGDTFSEIYLSYQGKLPSHLFFDDFAPDEKYLYVRGESPMPRRFIRAYRLRDPKTGSTGPWLAGMTLDPTIVTEAWCHQRGYVCMIEEFGKRPQDPALLPGDQFSAAFVVGYFDSITEMEQTYDLYAGHTGLTVNSRGWRLTGSHPSTK